MTPYELLRRAVAADGARPFVTMYDDATGERAELSVATFDNWVAKTANLLQDGLAVEPGDRVAVALPVHWQAFAVVMACWAAGTVVVPGDAPGAAVTFAAGDALAAAAGTGGEVVGLSLRPLAGPLASPPAGVQDYALEVPAYGDRFAAYAPACDDDPAVEAGGATLAHGELVARAGALAAERGWGDGARLLTTREALDVPALVGALVAPLVLGGSVVVCRNADRAALAGRRAAERVVAEFH